MTAAADLLAAFPAWAARLTITSKEYGLVPFRFWGNQRYATEAMTRGLADGRHIFYILKYRQAGETTRMLGLDLYWPMRLPGLQGQVIFDTDENRAEKHETVNEMLGSLPKAYAVPALVNNRTLLKLKNRSRLMFQAAGVKAAGQRKTAIGQGRGINYLHCTEVSSWADQDALERLTSSLAEVHPYRLYVFESTARGYNLWYDLWRDAQRAVSIQPIFLGWWRHELCRVERTSLPFQTYWTGKLTSQERLWTRGVQAAYGVTLEPEQLAWWRYILAERKGGNEAVMLQEYPTLPEEAFQATGSQFLSTARVLQMFEGLREVSAPAGFRYRFGQTIDDPQTEVLPASAAHSELAVWEEPIPGAPYVVAGDPAYGSSERSDRFVAQVWRAEGRRLLQVAEYASRTCTMKFFAWVLLHLCGVYRHPAMICELSGPGKGVWDEIQWLQQYGWGFGGASPAGLLDMVGGIRHYLWWRSDATRPAYSWQWKTVPSTKEPLMHQLRSEVEAGAIVPRSRALVEELKGLHQDGADVSAQGAAKDDRAIACALAVEAWLKVLVPQMGLAPAGESPAPEADPTVLGRSIRTFLRRLQPGGVTA